MRARRAQTKRVDGSSPNLWLLLGLPLIRSVELSALVYASLLGLAHLLLVAQFSRQA